jgi:uroporphyrinogen decarboxylase
MNKRDRLEATIAGEKIDRVPVAVWRHWPGDDQRAEDMARAHIEFQTNYDWDFVKVTPSSSFCLEQWNVRDRWEGSAEGTRRYLSYPVQQADDWRKIHPADIAKDGFERQLECLKLLHNEFGAETPFVQTVFSPLAQAKNLVGADRLPNHIRQYPAVVYEALKTITATTIAFLEQAKKQGIAGIYYAAQLATYGSFSKAEHLSFGRPFDIEILAAAADLWLNILHIHGTEIMFDSLADYPVHVVNWHDRETAPSLAQGIQQIKGAASGGVSRDALLDDDSRLAISQARDAFEETAGRRWILGTGCVAMVTTPVGNLRRLRQTADQLTP